MSLMDRLLKSSTLEHTDVLEDSKFLTNRDVITTPVPMMNVAFCGDLTGGFGPGLTVFAGPSKHFKSNMSLLEVAAYLKKYDEAVCLFYDSEFGASKEYFSAFGIDPKRVLHTPIEDIEQMKFDMVNQLENITKGDKVIIFVDSVGNLASKKEIEDAKDQKSVADMTRAKALKSFFRIVTPKVVMRDLPFIVVAHTYDTQEMYSKKVVSGGTGIYYSANNIFIVGRRQNKDKKTKEILGYEFILNVDKSRTIKEGSAIPINVTFEGGVDKYSGLLDIALATGHVVKPKNGWYTRIGVKDDKNWRKDESSCKEFWNPILKEQDFQDAVKQMFIIGGKKKMFTEELVAGVDFDPETGEVFEDIDDNEE